MKGHQSLGLRALTCALVFSATPALAQDEGLPLPAVPATVASRPRAPAPFPTTVVTRFDPAVDGLPFPNVGDYREPDGNCLGMSLVAIDNFRHRMDAERAGRPAPAPRDVDREQELVSYAQSVAGRLDDSSESAHPVGTRRPLNDPAPIRAAIERMARTGLPEVLSIWAPNGGHATVIYGYRDGALLIYDPNYPGRTIRWPFDPVTGLGPHPLGATDPTFYGALDRVSSDPAGSFQASGALPHLRAASVNGTVDGVGRYPTIDVRVAPASGGRVTISGRIANPTGKPGNLPSSVAFAVGGHAVGTATVGRDGTFRATVPAAGFARGENTLRVVASAGSGKASLFAGVVERTVSPLGPAAPRVSTGITSALSGSAR